MGVAISSGVAKAEPAITLSMVIGVPAAVIAIASLYGSAHLQRSAYIKDYAIKFRTDRDLSESFHYLVVNYGNKDLEILRKSPASRTSDEVQRLEDGQKDLPADLRFFDPEHLTGKPQERRLDSLLGFFDAVGYDYVRGLVTLDDVAGMFGVQLEHFNQRRPVQEYIDHVRGHWSKLTSFKSVVEPYTYLDYLLNDYKDYCDREAQTQRVRNRMRRARI